jgi:putative ABC transport system permease protein
MKNGRLRKALVVLQFSISIIIMSGTIIMLCVKCSMLNKDLGFNKEQLMVITHRG